jgi:hypothetical protein
MNDLQVRFYIWQDGYKSNGYKHKGTMQWCQLENSIIPNAFLGELIDKVGFVMDNNYQIIFAKEMYAYKLWAINLNGNDYRFNTQNDLFVFDILKSTVKDNALIEMHKFAKIFFETSAFITIMAQASAATTGKKPDRKFILEAIKNALTIYDGGKINVNK